MNEKDLQSWIKKCEKLELQTYIDTTGHCTVGWGRNLENGISLDEAELMFKNDYNRSVDELEKCQWYLDQPQGVQFALINMNFNLGINKLSSFKKMIAALEKKDYATASREALNSRWATQVHQRAKDIALMISEGK